MYTCTKSVIIYGYICMIKVLCWKKYWYFVIKMTEITFRVASEVDYEDILRIHDNVYDGLDYIPSLYHQFLNKEDVKVMLALIKEKVVRILILIIRI